MVAAALAEDVRPIPEGFSLPEGEIVFSSNAAQAGLRAEGDLGALAKENSALGDQANAFGFAAKSDEANTFLVGALYSEALAFLRSGDFESAVDRLEALEQQAIRLGVPSSLFGHVSKTLTLVRQQRYSQDVLLDFLSLFQPYFEDYARGRSEDFLTLFRAGSWLVDLSLAAAVGNTSTLQQRAHLDYIMREMERMDAPQGVNDALGKIAAVAKKDEITARDSKTVIDQVKRIQSILG